MNETERMMPKYKNHVMLMTSMYALQVSLQVYMVVALKNLTFGTLSARKKTDKYTRKSEKAPSEIHCDALEQMGGPNGNPTQHNHKSKSTVELPDKIIAD